MALDIVPNLLGRSWVGCLYPTDHLIDLHFRQVGIFGLVLKGV